MNCVHNNRCTPRSTGRDILNLFLFILVAATTCTLQRKIACFFLFKNISLTLARANSPYLSNQLRKYSRTPPLKISLSLFILWPLDLKQNVTNDGIIDIAIQICLIGWSPGIRNDTYGIYECTRVVRAYQERDSPWPYFRSYRPARYYLTRYRSCLWMKPVVVAAPSNCSWRPYHLCSLLAQLYVGTYSSSTCFV